MAGGKSDYLKSQIVNFMYGGLAWTPGASVWLALGTAADSSSFTEVSGGAYARVSITRNTTNFPTPTTPGLLVAGGPFTFPQATASWGSVGFFAFYDAATSGNRWHWGPLSNTGGVVNIASGQVPTFNSGTITVAEA